MRNEKKEKKMTSISHKHEKRLLSAKSESEHMVQKNEHKRILRADYDNDNLRKIK